MKNHQIYQACLNGWTQIILFNKRRYEAQKRLHSLLEEYDLLGHELSRRIRHLLLALSPNLAGVEIHHILKLHKERRGWNVKTFPEIVITITYQGKINAEGIRDRARVEVQDFLQERSVRVTLLLNLRTS